MARGRPKKQDTTLTDEFKNVVASSSTDELKTKVVALSNNEESVLVARSEDQALDDAKELTKQLSEPYSSSLKEIRARRKYVLKTLTERGAQ